MFANPTPYLKPNPDTPASFAEDAASSLATAALLLQNCAPPGITHHLRRHAVAVVGLVAVAFL